MKTEFIKINQLILYNNKIILPRFDKCIEIVDNDNDNNLIDIHIRNRSRNNIHDFNNSKSFSITERDSANCFLFSKVT